MTTKNGFFQLSVDFFGEALGLERKKDLSILSPVHEMSLCITLRHLPNPLVNNFLRSSWGHCAGAPDCGFLAVRACRRHFQELAGLIAHGKENGVKQVGEFTNCQKKENGVKYAVNQLMVRKNRPLEI